MGEQNSPFGPGGIHVLPAADTSRTDRKWLDLAYGKDSAFQRLDLYLPGRGRDSADRSGKGSRPASGYPVVVHIHGGAWMMCNKSDRQLEPVLRALDRGLAVASVNYRLSQEAVFPAQLRDVRAALAFLAKEAGRFGLDAGRLALWGGSAGAHLSSLAALATDPGLTGQEQAGAAPVKAVVAWFGPTDFLAMDRYLAENGLGPQNHGEADSPESRLLGTKTSEVPELVRLANPESWVGSHAPDFLLQHGLSDSTVPWQHSRDLAARLEAVQGPGRSRLDLLEGAEHADPAFETAANVGLVLDWLEERL